MGTVAAPPFRRGAEHKWEKWLRRLLWLVAVLSAAFIAMYLYGGLVNDEEFRFVANSCAKDALFVALAVVGAIDVKRFARPAVALLVLGHGTLIVANAMMLIKGGSQPDPK